MENIKLDSLQRQLLDDILAGETNIPTLATKYGQTEAKIKSKIHSMDTGIRAKLTAHFDKKKLQGLLTGERGEEVTIPKHVKDWPDFLLKHGLRN